MAETSKKRGLWAQLRLYIFIPVVWIKHKLHLIPHPELRLWRLVGRWFSINPKKDRPEGVCAWGNVKVAEFCTGKTELK